MEAPGPYAGSNSSRWSWAGEQWLALRRQWAWRSHFSLTKNRSTQPPPFLPWQISSSLVSALMLQTAKWCDAFREAAPARHWLRAGGGGVGGRGRKNKGEGGACRRRAAEHEEVGKRTQDCCCCLWGSDGLLALICPSEPSTQPPIKMIDSRRRTDGREREKEGGSVLFCVEWWRPFSLSRKKRHNFRRPPDAALASHWVATVEETVTDLLHWLRSGVYGGIWNMRWILQTEFH